jgi:hypothetical protein
MRGFVRSVRVDFWFNAALKEKWWWSDLFGILASILSGGIISLFYFLVVLIPERRKKTIIKNNLQRMYRNIKKHNLWQVIFASGGDEQTLIQVQI